MGRTGAGPSPVPGASLVARMDQSNATRSDPTFRMNRFERSHTATSLRPGSFIGTTFGFFGMVDTVGRCSQEKSSQRAVACLYWPKQIRMFSLLAPDVKPKSAIV